MAKSKKPEENEPVTYLGENVDPEIQKRVEGYMEMDAPVEPPEPPEPPAATKIKVSDESAASAPLLPTAELPESLQGKSSEKAKTPIAVTMSDDEEPETVEPEPEAPEEAAPVDTAPELEASEAPTEPEEDAIAEEAPEDVPESLRKSAELPEPPAPKDELGLEDVQTSHAVEEIIAHEADDLLAAEDEKKGIASASAPVPAKKSKKEKKSSGNPLKKLLNRKVLVVVILLLIAAAIIVPGSRYYVLNSAGVRASTSLTVLDEKSSQPLKNVELSIGSSSAKTDGDGYVKLDKIKLGAQQMVIKKSAFAEQTRTVTIGWGSNPQGDLRLVPVGTQYTFIFTNFLSGKPVKNTEVTFGEASAKANDKGEAVLTVPRTELDEIEVQTVAGNYRNESVKVSTSSKEKTAVSLVPARKVAYVSKRSGTLDLYKSDVDGKNETKVVTGSGLEREDGLSVVMHPKKNLVAFLSTKDNVRNQDGFLLSTLQVIDLENNEATRVTQSERVQVIDWSGDRLVYVKVKQGASQASNDRHKLMSYDTESGQEKELATTNYFNDVLSVNGSIYYTPAAYNVNGQVGLYKINADGTNKKTVYQKEAWNLFRVSFDKISVSIGQDWFDLDLSNDQMTKAAGAPPMLKSRVYVTSPEGKRSLWVDERDGKGVLIVYDHGSKQDTVLQSQGGIKNPIHWLDEEHVVYRVANGTETADYVLSLNGGAPKKIKDVTNTAGIDRWYYY